ncbi:MAG: radical SAM family heme chaperone HemW [Christensenellales bacterium]
MKELALYIHIPFCRRKCRYCDFVSYDYDEDICNSYINSLIEEICIYKDKNYLIKTAFIGGGTPSLIDIRHIEQIINAIDTSFTADITEFSIELNPESVSEDKIKAYKSLGINRVSLGVQSLSERLLSALGRIHNPNDAIKALEIIRKHFDNVNIDLMTGLPYETEADADKSLKIINAFEIPHISLYTLMLEESAPLYKDALSGNIELPDNDESAALFERTSGLLEDAGIYRYEISNFAKNGYLCRHNLTYWTAGEYMGLGLGAHGYLNEERYSNHTDFKSYSDNLSRGSAPVSIRRYIDSDESEFEYIMLGLRLVDGIDLTRFKERYNKDFMKAYYKQLKELEDYLIISDKRVSARKEYLNIINSIILKFMK